MVWPVATKSAMVTIQLTMAIIKGEIINASLRKKRSSNRKMMSIAVGAERAICLNISTPKVSSATGRPVMW